MVVGAGRLGIRIALIWKNTYPTAKVTVKNKSKDIERSKQFKKEGFVPITKEESQACRAPFVVFCAPSMTGCIEDIEFSIKEHWDTDLPVSAFVLTSSGGVYEDNFGDIVDENTETTSTQRSPNLLAREKIVRENKGCILRLAGLYCKEYGNHHFWRGVEKIPLKPKNWMNLLHYDDAARAVVKCLQNPSKIEREVFLVADGYPMYIQDIANVTGIDVQFTGGEGIAGKIYDISKIKTELEWEPECPKFYDFFQGTK